MKRIEYKLKQHILSPMKLSWSKYIIKLKKIMTDLQHDIGVVKRNLCCWPPHLLRTQCNRVRKQL